MFAVLRTSMAVLGPAVACVNSTGNSAGDGGLPLWFVPLPGTAIGALASGLRYPPAITRPVDVTSGA